MIVALALRVLAILAVVVGLAYVAASIDNPTQTWIDVVARIVAWAIIATVCWAVADLRLEADARR